MKEKYQEQQENILINFLMNSKLNTDLSIDQNEELAGTIFKKIKSDYFINNDNKLVFESLKQLYLNDLQLNQNNVKKHLLKNKIKTNNEAYNLIFKYNDVEFIENFDFINDIIKELIEYGHIAEIQKALNNANVHLKTTDLKTVYLELENLMKNWVSGDDSLLIRLGSSMKQELEHIEKIASSGTGLIGVQTGYPKLDQITQGLQNGNLIILAARPSFGKTALALNIAKNISEDLQKNEAVLFVSLEMSREEITKRFLSCISSISLNKILTGKYSQDDKNHLDFCIKHFEKNNIFITELASLDPVALTLLAKDLAKKKKLKLIVIDYLQLMEYRGKKGINREQEVSSISRKLKILARELKIPVLAISQLSRRLEIRENKRPIMSDLRESGALEQDADVVLFLYRDEYYRKQKDNSDYNIYSDSEPIEVIVGKNRNGPIGSFSLTFFKTMSKFEHESS